MFKVSILGITGQETLNHFDHILNIPIKGGWLFKGSNLIEGWLLFDEIQYNLFGINFFFN